MKFLGKILATAIFSTLLFSKNLAAQNPTKDSTAHAKQRAGAIRIDTTLAKIQAATQPKVDSLPLKTDSAATVNKESFFFKFFKKDYPNPRKAMFMSLILPGSGQIYNRSYWKVPLVYGAIGTLTFVEIHNVKAHRELKTAYFNKVNNLPVDAKFEKYDATSIKKARDSARRFVELSSVWLGLSVLLSTAEAFTDAHLKRFDVSDDLSMRIVPDFSATQTGFAAAGFGIKFSLKNPKTTQIPIQSTELQSTRQPSQQNAGFYR